MTLTKTHSTNYRLVIIAYLSFAALGLSGGMLGVAWPSIRDTFEVPSAALGTLLFCGIIGYFAAGIFNGYIVTRLGTGRTLMIASLLSAAGIAGYGIAPDWWFIIAAALLLGIGQGILDAALNLFFASNYSPRLMNWLHAAYGLGAALGPLLMTLLFSLDQSWRAGYLLSVLFQIALAISFGMSKKEWQLHHHDEASADAPTPSIARTLGQPAILLSILLFFFFTGAEATAANWSFTLFTESRGVDIYTAGQWSSLYWWSFTLGRLVFGFIADRTPLNLSVRACMLMLIGGSLLLALNLSDWISFIGLVVAGFGLAPLFPLLMTATPQRVGSRYTTNAIGFQVGAASLGIAIMPALAGLLAEQSTLEVIGPFLVIVSVISLLLFQIIQR